MKTKKIVITSLVIVGIAAVVVGLSEWVKTNNIDKIAKSALNSMSSSSTSEQKEALFKQAAIEDAPLINVNLSKTLAADANACIHIYYYFQFLLRQYSEYCSSTLSSFSVGQMQFIWGSRDQNQVCANMVNQAIQQNGSWMQQNCQ